MKRLFIAEKPSVAKALAAELGKTETGSGWIRCGNDVITWCFGHMLEQAEPDEYTADDVPRGGNGRKLWRVEDLPIIPRTWKSVVKEDAREQLTTIGKLLKQADVIVNAGDPDHEGQLLVDEVLEHFSNQKPVQRYWANAQDSISIQRALGALKDNASYRGWRDAARGRQRADWLIGMNLSRAFTLRARRGGSSSLVPVGRVQTPTLAIVVQRDREIEAFKSQPFHTITARMARGPSEFVCKWVAREDQSGLDSEGRLVDGKIANELVTLVTGKAGVVSGYEQRQKTEAQPLSFSLTDLSVLASRKFGYSAEQVLDIAQALYEKHKLASYPRTDCGYLPESQHADAPSVLKALKAVNPELTTEIDHADPGIKSPTWNDKKVTAHHGIIPTMHVGSKEGMSAEARNVYELIVRRYLAQFYPRHEYLATTIDVAIGSEHFTATGRTVTEAGWKVVCELADEKSEDKSENKSDEGSDEEQLLPVLKEGDEILCVSATRHDRKTKPPPRYTDGSLLRAMENIHRFVTDPSHKKLLKDGDGIGTSATRATIIAELKKRGFLQDQKKQVHSTPLGRSVIDALPAVVTSPVLTALYQRLLSEIERGEASLEEFEKKQCDLVRGQVAKANDGAIRLAEEAVRTSAGAGGKRVARATRG